MTQEQAIRIREEVEFLAHRGGTVFGAASHGFHLSPVLTESEVAAFERQHGVALPQDYRLFLMMVGGGGAGPYHGLFRFGETDDGFDFRAWRACDGFVGTPGTPFPHTAAWNDLDGLPCESLAGTDEGEYSRQMEKFEERYYRAIDGAIPICHLGCALRQWLVVTGPEAGHVWLDSRSDFEGLSPVLDDGVSRTTFYVWYRTWLDKALAAAPDHPPA